MTMTKKFAAIGAALALAFSSSAQAEGNGFGRGLPPATDNADKIGKKLTQDYNRARQSQITTELSEIMGGVEAMKG